MAQARLRRHEVFDFLRPEQVDALSEAAERVRFRAGDTVLCATAAVAVRAVWLFAW